MIAEVLESILGWQVGTAALFFGITVAALSVLNKDRREEIALWLMGAMPEETWSKTFLSMFDALFYGPNRSRIRFFLVSALLSTTAVSLVWLAMWQAGTLRVELEGMSLWQAIAIGVAINIVADYVSLLETRFLLSRMPRNALLQVLVLILDAAITAAIILVTIWAATQTGLVPQDRTHPLVVALAFSIYSAPFYSTFLTSVWSWLYILSTWVLRAFTRLRLAYWLDVENKPVLFLSLALSVFVWLGTLGVSKGLEKDPEFNLSYLDTFACTFFKGEICLRMLGITEAEETRFLLQTLACEGGANPEACFLDPLAREDLTPERMATLLSAACAGGDALACTNLGFLFEKGLGGPQDAAQARAFYRQGCEGGDANGCTNLGFLFRQGLGGPKDAVQARALYRQGCDGGHARGCTNLGFLFRQGLGGPQDAAQARALYRQGCEGGDAGGCTNLGWLFETGLGGPEDAVQARALYRQGCDGGNARGCTNLGVHFENGLGGPQDTAEARALYRQGCDGGNAFGCTNLGLLFEKGHGGPNDPVKATELYGQACDMEHAKGCYYVGWNLRDGIGVSPDKAEALIYLRKGCDLGNQDSCDAAERLAAE